MVVPTTDEQLHDRQTDQRSHTHVHTDTDRIRTRPKFTVRMARENIADSTVKDEHSCFFCTLISVRLCKVHSTCQIVSSLSIGQCRRELVATSIAPTASEETLACAVIQQPALNSFIHWRLIYAFMINATLNKSD